MLSVPEFLVPAIVRPSNRSFSATRRRRAKTQTYSEPSLDSLKDSAFYTCPAKPVREPLPLRVPIPEPDVRHDIQPWLAAIDPFLPDHLRQGTSGRHDAVDPASTIDFAWLLNAAQDASHDILSHMGLVEGRWDAVTWIVKKLMEDGPSATEPPIQPESSANTIWPETEPRSLHDLTNGPLRLERVRPSKRLRHTLDDLTSAPDTINFKDAAVKRALGQVWRSLGNMILEAAEESNNKDSQILPHVLGIIAHLHHIGMIPDSVYTHRPTQDAHALRQPPTLHLLSSTILTALSDATWRAHEASVTIAKERMNASYFLGHEIPGSRFKTQVTEIAPELWLELVLWSCLHGGWILDGTAVLERMFSHRVEDPWGLISWREISLASEEKPTVSGWRLFSKREDITTEAEARARTQKKVSSEVVTGFIDGLVNTMRVGIGARGTPPEKLVHHIKSLKQLLDRSSLSLGSATWDSIMVRLLESGGVIPQKRPELLLSILDLASGFGSEVSSANASSQPFKASKEPPYYFEPSTTPISLLHQTMRSFLESGDISGVMTTLNVLQHYTDSNKQKSMQQFFEALKTVQVRQDQLFMSRVPAIDFPAFDTQLPVVLLAKVLDLATDAKLFDLGRWLLLSDELDGPLITREMYTNSTMASSIIRFGTMAGENDLVMKVVKMTSTWNSNQQTQRIPDELQTALLSSQVKLNRWNSVRSMQNYVLANPGYRPQPTVLAEFIAELLRHSPASDQSTQKRLQEARSAFTDFLFAWEGIVLTHLKNELYSILGIVSSVREDWKEYCSHFLAFSTRQGIRLSTDDFNHILSGVLDGFDSLKGKELVEKWCYKLPKTFEPYRAPGGLPTMPQYRAGKAEEYKSRPADIEINQSSGAKLILQGRVHPNRQTVWAILRKVQQEEDERRARNAELTTEKRTEVRETLKWAARLLYSLGFDHEDIIRGLGDLAEIAELDAPPSSKVTGLPDVQRQSF